MKISVIIPTFRPKDYLWDCLTSLERQTLDHKLFEIVLVLNGDKEPYCHNISTFLSEHPTLSCRLIYNETAGVGAARNRGLDEAVGEYICFMDDDDLVTEHYLEALLEIASDDTTALSYITAFDDGQDNSRAIFLTHQYRNTRERLPYTVARRYFYVPYAKILHRNIIGDRRFNTSLKNGEDALFMFLISNRLKWARFTDQTAEYRYRQRPESAFNASRPASYHISNMLQCQYEVSRIFWRHPLSYSPMIYIKHMLASLMACYRHLRNIKL